MSGAPAPGPRLQLYRLRLPGPPSGQARAAPARLAARALLDLAPAEAPRFYWQAFDEDLALAAFGAVHRARAEGPDRWGTVAAACRAARERLTLHDPAAADAEAGPAARWLGGFAFEDRLPDVGTWEGFPAAEMSLPRATLAVRGDRAWLSVAGEEDAEALRRQAEALAARLGDWVGSDSARPVADRSGGAGRLGEAWDPGDLPERIARLIAAIRRGEAEKVVLATARSLSLEPPADPLAVLDRMRAAQMGCTHLLVSPRPGLALVAATPERLLRLRGDRIETMALAGSARRDPDPARDRALGEALLASPKDQAEHAVVVAAIRDALAPALVRAPATPRLRRLATIQHLETPIETERPAGADLLGLAARLHPTPALAGQPRAAARRLIQSAEVSERGWYGGAVGWLDGRGEGDLAVVIRGLLLRGARVTAYAGAGIVADSEPEAETREIGLKLATALSALG